MDGPEPIIISRSANRNGETFALHPFSRRRLQAQFGNLPANARIFIGHDMRYDSEHIHGSVVPQVIALLTGVSEDRLRSLGGVVFVDPVTEKEIPVTRAEPLATAQV